jgi:putative ABC transport system permease protein
MLKNYLSIALRQLVRQKLYSAINIAGLSIGLTCFILIALFVQYERSYDRHYENADRIYRISRDFVASDASSLELGLATMAPQAAELLKLDFPQIVQTARIFVPFTGGVAITRDGFTSFERGFVWVDNELFEIFDFEWLAGDPAWSPAPWS